MKPRVKGDTQHAMWFCSSCKEWVGNKAVSFLAAQTGKQPNLKMAKNALALLPRSSQDNPGGCRILAWCFLVGGLKWTGRRETLLPMETR